MRSPQNHKTGLIAVLDAMGAASYGVTEIARFMESREIVLAMAREKAEEMLDLNMLNVFTFNDTIVFSLTAKGSELAPGEVSAFFQLLRKFMVDSLQNKILFRGSIAAGTFYVDKLTNTIMGEAVTDAASWYSQADWIGIHATPRTTLLLNALLERRKENKDWVMVDYDVPMKGGSRIRLKAVNWPKAFFVRELVKDEIRQDPRAMAQMWLASQPIPKGAEGKCLNAVAFFDFVVDKLKLKPLAKKGNESSANRSPSVAAKRTPLKANKR
jgi:hypothetical protein